MKLTESERIKMISYIVKSFKEGSLKPSRKAINRFENVLNNASDDHVRHLYNFNKIKEKKG